MRHLAPLAAVCMLAAAFFAPAAAADEPWGDGFTPAAAPATAAAPPAASGEAWQPDPSAEPAADAPPAAAKADAPRVTGRRARVALVLAAASGAVTIRDFSFTPATVNVVAGDTVTWKNNGKTDHTATGKLFDTGVLSPGSSGSFTFKDAGTFAYVCSIHPNMKGTVKVAAAASGEGGQAGGGAGGSNGSEPSGARGARLPRTGWEEVRLAGFGALLLAFGAAARLGPARRRAAR